MNYGKYGSVKYYRDNNSVLLQLMYSMSVSFMEPYLETYELVRINSLKPLSDKEIEGFCDDNLMHGKISHRYSFDECMDMSDWKMQLEKDKQIKTYLIPNSKVCNCGNIIRVMTRELEDKEGYFWSLEHMFGIVMEVEDKAYYHSNGVIECECGGCKSFQKQPFQTMEQVKFSNCCGCGK
tara:strand:- start:1740 stop:2279 length:540 start_codon:yes stop_codon:yes gene_type:complete